MDQKQKKSQPSNPQSDVQSDLFGYLVKIICATNGIALQDTLELATKSLDVKKNKPAYGLFCEFRELLSHYQQYSDDIDVLLQHPVGQALHEFFKKFPIPFNDEHIHLTGSLTPEYIYSKLDPLLGGPNGNIYESSILSTYGEKGLPITSPGNIDSLIRMNEIDDFARYLVESLYLAKLILSDRQAHRDAAYHMAKDVSENYNVGKVRLKFTLSRTSKMQGEQIPGSDALSSEDAILGLYEGFMDYKKECSSFDFVLSPSFRKEPNFYDQERFASKSEDFMHQVDSLISLLETHPELGSYVKDVDTVGSEKKGEMYRKAQFFIMQPGFHKLHQYGFRMRSHHGEIWHTLNKGIQAVDNAMNIWHIDTLEHGLSLGINPNYYFHNIYERVKERNFQGLGLEPESIDAIEVSEMKWEHNEKILQKILLGEKLSLNEMGEFSKVKFSTAIEVEYYQHDVLNRMIDKEIGLTSLPTSNKKLGENFPDYRNHPFSWWEKKQVAQAIGTDNYVTLGTNLIREMIILLLADPKNLKITKLLLVATGDNRRPYMSKLLWDMKKLVE